MDRYSMVISPISDEDGGGYMARFPDLPGCMSDGETPDAAARNALDAFAVWMEVQIGRKVAIPAPESAHAGFRAWLDGVVEERDRLAHELEAAQARIRELERTAAQEWSARSHATGDDDRLYA
ncbi:MAG: type II toxin-antitoxin system HicB family antitoxin [Rubellimicrobium sp.]|nr:type II toxin-antitoxin system HicB family antitoxin [Rubellimicrobium sp.]